MSDTPACECEFAESVCDHFRKQFELYPFFSVVDFDDFPDHFGDDDHVTAVRLQVFLV